MYMKFVIMRPGTFNLSDSIKYVVSVTHDEGNGAVTGGTSLNIVHSEYEALYLEVKDTDVKDKKLRKEKQEEDMFRQMFKKDKEKVEEVDFMETSQLTKVKSKKDMEEFMNFEFQNPKQEENPDVINRPEEKSETTAN